MTQGGLPGKIGESTDKVLLCWAGRESCSTLLPWLMMEEYEPRFKGVLKPFLVFPLSKSMLLAPVINVDYSPIVSLFRHWPKTLLKPLGPPGGLQEQESSKKKKKKVKFLLKRTTNKLKPCKCYFLSIHTWENFCSFFLKFFACVCKL